MTFGVLVVCTGNIARSPMAQRLLQHRLGEGSDVRVSSAGTWGHEGSTMERHAVAALAEVGLDDGGFRARELTAAMVREADLVLTATREHRVAVVSLDPDALPRTFTLREFARLVRAVQADARRGGPASVVAAAASSRGAIRVPPTEDDVTDPYGGPLRSYRRARDVIGAAVDVIVPVLAEPGAAGSAPGGTGLQ